MEITKQEQAPNAFDKDFCLTTALGRKLRSQTSVEQCYLDRVDQDQPVIAY